MPCSACPKEKVFSRGLCQACYYRQRRNGTTTRKNVVNSGACSHPECDRHSFSKNLCSLHYHRAQHPLYGTWQTMRSRAQGAYPEHWDRFESFLADVGERPGPKHMFRRPDPSKPWSKINMVWREPVGVKWKGNITAYQWVWHLKNRYGITPEQVEQMAKDQDGRCACCPVELVKAKKVCVDHDHVTRQVRGLLCDACNKAIGLMNDEPARLRAAAVYLELHSVRKVENGDHPGIYGEGSEGVGKVCKEPATGGARPL